MPPLSLSRFFSLNLGILLLVVMACLSYTAFTLYDWGLEDSLTYLMAAEGENWQPEKSQGVSRQDGIFQVYEQWQHLPENYRSSFEEAELAEHILGAEEQEQSWLYVLPIYSQEHNQLLYVTHTYHEQYGQYLPGPEVSDWVLLFSTVILFIALLILWRLIRPLSNNIKNLARWSQQLAGEQDDMSKGEFAFKELQQVAQSVHYLATSLQQKNKQESLLLRSLSHELRNPLAITRVALDRIDQQQQVLPPQVDKVLAKIRRANLNMCQIGESILWLWAESDLPQNIGLVDLEQILKQELCNQQYLLQGKQSELDVNLTTYQLQANHDLLTILSRNLIRNAFQYTGAGRLTIRLEPGQLTIFNPATDSEFGRPYSDYGYGVGLLLVQRICDKCQWQWQVTNDNGVFSVSVVF